MQRTRTQCTSEMHGMESWNLSSFPGLYVLILAQNPKPICIARKKKRFAGRNIEAFGPNPKPGIGFRLQGAIRTKASWGRLGP